MNTHITQVSNSRRFRSLIRALLFALVIASLHVVSVAAQERPAPPVPNFSGDWVEIKAPGEAGPAMRLQIK